MNQRDACGMNIMEQNEGRFLPYEFSQTSKNKEKMILNLGPFVWIKVMSSLDR